MTQRDLVAELQRWQDAGATWRVVDRDQDTVTVSMCQCTGGAEVERVTTSDARVVAFVDAAGGRSDA